jgi:hypothetical protein
MKQLILSVVMVVATITTSCSQNIHSQIKGEWESVQAEDLGNKSFGWREFKFSDDNWEISFTLYLDQAMTMPVFTFRSTGTFEVLQASNDVSGANNAVFKFSKKFVTLKSTNPDVIKGFGFDQCKLETNVEKDITENGCSFLMSTAAYAQEYDLVSLKDAYLFLGARPADGNMSTAEKRPTSLGYPLAKKK